MLPARWPRTVLALAAAMALVAASCAHAPRATWTWKQIEALPPPPAGQRITYGDDSLQFGDLRVPPGHGPFPVAIVIHGGCWHSEYDLGHVAPLAAELTRRGVATWSIEYRRVGDPGAGWPGTFQDVARAADFVRELARSHSLDTSRVIAIGHSAGGHLALWLAARPHLPASSALAAADPLPLRGVVGLAAIADLSEYSRGASWCGQAAAQVMGGTADSLASRYAEADPSLLLPLRVPVRLVQGSDDKIVPIEQGRRFVERGLRKGDDVRLAEVRGAGHFDVIAPPSPAFAPVARAVAELLRR